MPDARLQRTRATLPEGYRFGDAHPRQAGFFAAHGMWERDAIRATTFTWSSFDAAMREVDLRSSDRVVDTDVSE